MINNKGKGIFSIVCIENIKRSIAKLESGSFKLANPASKAQILTGLYSKLEKLEAIEQEKKHSSLNLSSRLEPKLAKDIELYIEEIAKANPSLSVTLVIAELLKLVLASDTSAPCHVHWPDLYKKLDVILTDI